MAIGARKEKIKNVLLIVGLNKGMEMITCVSLKTLNGKGKKNELWDSGSAAISINLFQICNLQNFSLCVRFTQEGSSLYVYYKYCIQLTFRVST